MRATVIYVQPSDEQCNAIKLGESSREAKAYLRASAGERRGHADALALGMMRPAATLETTTWTGAPETKNETVWMMLQNLDRPWTASRSVVCLTDFPRSMSVGDVIVWDTDEVFVARSIGFERLEAAYAEPFINMVKRRV